MNLRFLSAAAFPLIWLLALPAWAAEYRLEVADLDYQTYSAYDDPYYRPDSVYAVVKLPPAPRTYKLVIAWRDHGNRETPARGGEQN